MANSWIIINKDNEFTIVDKNDKKTFKDAVDHYVITYLMENNYFNKAISNDKDLWTAISSGLVKSSSSSSTNSNTKASRENLINTTNALCTKESKQIKVLYEGTGFTVLYKKEETPK